MLATPRSRALVLALLALVVLALMLVIADRALFGFTGPLGALQRRLATPEGGDQVEWRVVGRGFRQVTDIQFVPGSNRSAIVLLKDGKAHHVTLVEGATVTADQSPLVFEVEVRTQVELGLLGLAFHPKYRQNGLFYVNYTPGAGPQRSRVSEWRLSRERLGHERAEELRVILEVEQPFPNHNAGQLAFGPDGMLYIGQGDGGKRADPLGAGQDLSSLLGKMLRIDIDRREGDKAYAIVPDNPFLENPKARPEIWAYGLRNPWRYAFDQQGRLIVADVGQDEFEEVSIVERGDNLGWVVREARHCFPPGAKCSDRGFKDPVFEYGRKQGQSITGGTVYLGRALPSLVGKYVLADYESGNVWALALPASARGSAEATHLGQWARSISTFGRDAQGEIYAGDFGSGDLLKLVERRPAP